MKKYVAIAIILIALVSVALQSRDFWFKNQAQRLFLTSWETVEQEFYDKDMNDQDWDKWKTKYLNVIKTQEDAYVAIESVIASLNDPYTRFLRPEAFEEQNMNINAKLYGIGVNITEVDGKIVVLSILEDSPAQEACIKSGDVIVKVDGVDITGYSLREVAKVVRGPIDTEVKIDILRDKKRISVPLTRKEIKLKSVKMEFVDDIAHITISSFLSQDTPKEFMQAAMMAQDSKGIILDLRGNTGGLLPNAVLIANMFLPQGNIVSIVDRNGRKTNINASYTDFYVKKPVVVLIDKGSASASEILSGALKDYDRAKLVGETSFGKGLVQKIQPIPTGSAVNITIAKYLTPSGEDIHKKGIEPDYKVELSKNDILKGLDPQLEKAKEVIEECLR